MLNTLLIFTGHGSLASECREPSFTKVFLLDVLWVLHAVPRMVT